MGEEIQGEFQGGAKESKRLWEELKKLEEDNRDKDMPSTSETWFSGFRAIY